MQGTDWNKTHLRAPFLRAGLEKCTQWRRTKRGYSFPVDRYDLEKVFLKRGEDAIRELHAKAIATGDRDLLFALAEMSFLTGEQISRSIKPWEPRDARDYFLGAAVYAYLFLFFENDLPSAFDRRFRTACDLYNYGLGLALQKQHSTQGLIELNNMTRKLPVGELDIALDVSEFPWPMSEFEQFLLGGEFQVRGLSVRNRVSGLGTPLIAVPSRTIGYGLLRTTGATVFLRLAGGLKELASGHCHGALELRSAFGKDAINRGTQSVPLERDLTVPMAFNLNQSIAWELHKHQFLSLHEIVPSDVYSTQPYESGRIPVVFVHGTYSSPVRWAEMLNTLRADPELRSRYQFWFFIYNSSAPLVVSAGKLRRGIAARIAEFDPEGRDDALKHIVVIGHSQGGLLAKLISTNTKDKLWRAISEKPVDELNLSPAQKDEVRRLFFLESMPAVTRVVFIATPHRGSYWARGFVRLIARRLIRYPASLAGRAREVTSLALN